MLPVTFPGHDRCLPHGGMRPHRTLDLAELHPEASDLHLIVESPEELDGAV
jgi:hypothetical protein